MQVVVGRVGRAHGVHGDVSIEVRTDEPERRFMVGATLATDPASAGPLTVQRMRRHSGRLLLHFEELDDRSAAEALRGAVLLADIDPAETPDDPDEFYDRQLIGLAVHDVSLGRVGVISEVSHGSAQDLLVVQRDQAPDVLVPFVQAIVRSVDLDQGRVDVDLPSGLLDLAQG
jgi:16S rRNA processing protein RimM